MRPLYLLLLLASCECSWDNTGPGVSMEGPVPRHADRVVEVAKKYCHRDLRGRVIFLTGPSCWDCFHDNGKSGCMAPGLCHFYAQVSVLSAETDATTTALAHEIGHYCWETDDETKADDFAALVNRDVRGGP